MNVNMDLAGMFKMNEQTTTENQVNQPTKQSAPCRRG